MLRKRYLLTASIVLALLFNASTISSSYAAPTPAPTPPPSTTIADANANKICTTGDCANTVYVNAGSNQRTSCTGAVCHTCLLYTSPSPRD